MHSLIQNRADKLVLVIHKIEAILAHRLVWDLDFRKEFPTPQGIPLAIGGA